MLEERTIVIAEAGVNHNGKIELAKEMIEVASRSKADFIKFQSFNASDLVSAKAEKAEYQKKLTDSNETQLEMIKKLELTLEEQLQLVSYAQECGIKFLSTAFDHKSFDFLATLHLEYFKIPSGEITNLPYLIHIG